MDNVRFLRIQVFVYRFVGIDLHNAANDRPLLTLLTIGGLSAFLLPMFASAWLNITNVSVLAETMGSLISSCLSVTKYFIFLYYRKDLVSLINRIRELLNTEMSKSTQITEIVVAANKSDQMLSVAYTRCYISAAMFAALKPIVIMVAAYVRNGFTALELPHEAVYPWDRDRLFIYVPTYVWNCLVTYTEVAMSLCVDTLLFALTYNVCAIFKIAQHRVTHLEAATAGEESQNLVQIVHLHQTGLSIAAQLESYFRPLIFMQFFLSTLMICFVGFQAAYLFPQPECIYFIAFESSLLIELFIFSYCGQNMTMESANLGMAVYNSSWYDYAPSTKSMLIIAAMRAQRPCQMSGYFFEANMATFSTIVRSAMSYIMMLRSFNG